MRSFVLLPIWTIETFTECVQNATPGPLPSALAHDPAQAKGGKTSFQLVIRMRTFPRPLAGGALGCRDCGFTQAAQLRVPAVASTCHGRTSAQQSWQHGERTGRRARGFMGQVYFSPCKQSGVIGIKVSSSCWDRFSGEPSNPRGLKKQPCSSPTNEYLSEALTC